MMKTFLLSIIILMSSLAFGQFSNQQKQYLSMDNLLSNPGLENGKSGWTCSAGTFTADSSVKIDGGLTGKVVLSAQTLSCSITVATNAALQGAGAVILQALKSSVAGVKVCPIVDSVEDTNACVTYDGSDITKEVTPLYPLFGATNIGLKIKTDSAVTGTVYFDGSKIGRRSSASMPDVSQAQLAGSSYFAQNASCVWSRTTTTMGSFTTLSACPGPTITASSVGSWQTTDSDLPKQTITNLPPGTYVVTVNFGAGPSTAAGANGYTLTDGTTVCNNTSTAISVNNTSSGAIAKCAFTYTAASASRSFELLGQGTATSVANAYNNDARYQTSFFIEYYPPATSVMANYVPWKIDVNIGGANPSLGIVDVASYTEIANGSLDMVLNSGSANVQIPCSATNASTSTTCSAGNESLGVYIPALPYPGEFKVCAYFTHFSATASAGVNEVAFQLVQTTNSTQTIVQEGKTRTESYTYGGTSTVESANSISSCGNFVFTDTSAKTIRLMYEQDVTGTVSVSDLRLDRSAAVGQRDIHITVEPITPFMVASLAEKMVSPGILYPVSYKAYVGGASINTACTGTCTVFGDEGSFTLSVVRTVAGRYTFTSNNGKFSPGSYVKCEVDTATQSGYRATFQANSIVADANGAIASGSGEIRVYNASNTLADGDFWVECKGRLK